MLSFFFRYSIVLLWVWLRNQNEGDSPKEYVITSSNEYGTTVWRTENSFFHMFTAMTLNAFYSGWNCCKLTPELKRTIKSSGMITMF